MLALQSAMGRIGINPDSRRRMLSRLAVRQRSNSFAPMRLVREMSKGS